MAKSKEVIIKEIKGHIEKSGYPYSSWYVGISEDAKRRLFTDHNVQEKNAWWIYREASSNQVAREIEEYFVKTLRTDGGLGGGGEDADMVYAYKKGPNTNP